MKFDVYSDPQHSWLKVPFKKVNELGISGKISGCSYMRNDWVYLEEDVDAGIFIEAMNAIGKRVEFREHHTNKRSRIRGYDLYPYTEKKTPKKSGTYALVEGTKVYVGDWVGFKSDHEQSGKITKIVRSQFHSGHDLHLENENGFSGDYLRYATNTVVHSSDCWLG